MTSSSTNARTCGFALVIALGMMAFVLVLVLSITTLVQVETASSQTDIQRLGAEQNAFLGLNIALGNLQKLAGPDQRATATADILSDGYASVTAQNEAHAWTGVWDSTSADRDAGFLGWLVSAPTPGFFHSEEGDAITLPTAEEDKRQLVGEGTLGAVDSSRYVEVPKANIVAGDNSVSGRYAFWIGDEGVKAKFQGTQPSLSETTDERAQYDFRLNQRSAIEVFGDLLVDDLGAVFAADASKQPRSVSRADLLIADLPATVVPDAGNLKEAYFDITPYNIGLLTNSKDGGWRKDLTWLFEETGASVNSALASVDAKPASGATSEISADWPVDETYDHWSPSPTWELLRSFYRLSDENEPLAMRRQTATEHGVTPVITHLILNFLPGLNGAFQSGSDALDPSDDYFEGKLRVYIDAQVVIWNPYDVSIAMPELDLEVVWPSGTDSNGILVNRGDARMDFGDFGTSTQTHTGSLVDRFVGTTGVGFFDYNDQFTTPAVVGKGLKFVLPEITIGPGEMLIFGISDSEDGASYSGENVLENLSNLGLPNTVWLEHPDMIGAGTSPLRGEDLDEPFTFEKLFPRASNGNIYGGDVTQHVALKVKGTGGDDVPGNEANYFARFSRRKAQSTNFTQVFNFSNPSLTGEIFDINDDNVISGAEYGVLRTGPSTYSDHWLYFHAYMHSAHDTFRNTRWAINYNPRAPLADRTEVDVFNIPNFNGDWYSLTWPRHSFSNTLVQGGKTLVADRPNYTGSFSQYQASLYSLPRRGFKPLSIGDLQHANVHPAGATNAYIIANSLVDMRLKNTSAGELVRIPSSGGAFAPNVDGSYLLNDVLWDGYFFSTIDGSLTQSDLDSGFQFPNSHITMANGAGLDAFESNPKRFDEGSAGLLVDGMFNINSTSKDAWKSVLASSNGLDYDPKTAGQSGSALGIAFSRLMRPVDDVDQPWKGYRVLAKEELELLAEEIVDVIRRRGPFLSLADFVNRELGGDPEEPDPEFVKGTLAEAIDNAGINSNAALGLPSDTNDLSNLNSRTEEWYIEEAVLGSRSAGSTRWLTQGDILQRIGGMISARSDTFVIRSYGEIVAKVGGDHSGAYLEAVVRRVATPVVPLASDPLNPDPTATPDFGRRFEIVSIRWLQESEI